MKPLALAFAVCLVGTAALAETTIISRDPVDGSRTVIRERLTDPDTVVVKEKPDTTGTIGCSTTSTTRTNEDGETTRKTRTDC